MLCQYLRHIDLLAVYEQLDDFLCFETSGLANIQPQFCDTLAAFFEEIAEAATDDTYCRPWRELQPIDVAAEVGDLIEQQLELLAYEARDSIEQRPEEIADDTGDPLPGSNSTERQALDRFATINATALCGEPDYWRLSSLLIFQYDYLCWLYQKGAFCEAFELFEMIAETRCKIEVFIARGFDKQRITEITSQRARERAAKLHAPTNRRKAKLLAEWNATSGDYESRADFCRIVGQREGLKYRTLYDWIAQHERDKT